MRKSRSLNINLNISKKILIFSLISLGFLYSYTQDPGWRVELQYTPGIGHISIAPQAYAGEEVWRPRFSQKINLMVEKNYAPGFSILFGVGYAKKMYLHRVIDQIHQGTESDIIFNGEFIEIPILWNFSLVDKKKFALYGGIGIGVNFFYSQNSIMINRNTNSGYELTLPDTQYDPRTLSFSPIATLGFKGNIKEKGVWRIAPVYELMINPMQDRSFNVVHFIGLQAGIGLDFKRI